MFISPRLRSQYSLFIAAIVMFIGCGTKDPVETVITIESEKSYQVVVGWEATAQVGQDFPSFPEYRDKLLSDAAGDLGINRLRVEIRSGAENGLRDRAKGARYEIVNDNDDPFLINKDGFHFDALDLTIEQVVLPMRKLVTERGEELMVNLNYVDFGPSDFEHKDHPEEYAEFILAVFLHMREKYGFVPDAVEIILEPDTDTASWTARQVADALVATSSRLRSSGFDPAFIAPSTTNASNALAYIDEIATVAGAMDAIDEFSYHRYSGVSAAVLTGIAERATRYGKRTSMLEWIGADQDTLHEDLKVANVSAWQQFTLAYSGSDDGGAYYKIKSENSGADFTPGRRTKFLRQYFKCVRPGAIRVGASTLNASLDPVAFRGRNGSQTVVINADSPGTAVVRGLSPGRFSVSYTTDNETSVKAQDSELDSTGQLTVSIPSAGVLTICGEQ